MIVVVEARPDVGDAYVSALRREGIASAVIHAAEAVEWFDSLSGSDAVAVNAALLGEGAQTAAVVRSAKGHSGRPVIALADRRTLQETLLLFSLGVDDVVAKQVHARELLARVRVIASRASATQVRSMAGDVTLFVDGRDPEAKGRSLPLPRRERRILESLMDARGAWLTKSQIFSQVYGLFNEDVDESVIESHISRLRRRLRECLGRDAIESQRFLGYRFLSGAREYSSVPDLARSDLARSEQATRGLWSVAS